MTKTRSVSFGWLAIFVIFLLAVSAPVLAAPAGGNEPDGGQSALEQVETFPESDLPNAAQISEGIAKAEAEEEEEEAWLKRPAAIQEREASRTAYSDVDTTEAKKLLSETFAAELAQINADPARVLSNAQLLSSSEETSATINLDGNGVLMESSMPVRTENEEGALRKVDVGLERTGDVYETENGLVEVEIPTAANRPIAIGDEGISISLVGADSDRVAQPYGDANVFTAEVLPDTDMLVSPISTGVEISSVLRSQDSPKVLRYRVNIPPGAELRAASAGGFEVMSGDELLAAIPEPTAVDAQGTEVPVTTAVSGDVLTLEVDESTGDYALPILVDPILENGENWYFGANLDSLGNWGFEKNVAGMYGSTYCLRQCFNGSGRGLFVSGQSGYYWPNQYAQWAYSAPNGGYVLNPVLGPYVRYDWNCPASTYPQPHDYFGVWGPNGWVYLSINSSNQYGNAYYLPYQGQAVVFGLSTAYGEFSMPCWRDLYAGGANVYLDDNNAPVVESVSGFPSSWINTKTPFTITAQVSDAGLGVQNVLISPDGTAAIPDIPIQEQCSGTRRHPCLTGHTASWTQTGASFQEGYRSAAVTAYDPTGKYSTAKYFSTLVDGRAPEVNLEGQFAEATEEVQTSPGQTEAQVQAQAEAHVESLHLSVYNLKIEANDGSASSSNSWQSGVKNIEVFLDGVKQSVPWSPAGSCARNCSMTQTYPVKLSEVTTAGDHTLIVKVKDFVGNEREREIKFQYYPATGMKDAYVMQYFPLPNGEGNESEELHPRRPELAVNVANGNLVYRQTDFDISGSTSLPLKLERYYNSMLPSSENSEWGDGWTLAQTPELEPVQSGGGSPAEASLVDKSGLVEGNIALPTAPGSSKFDPGLQASVTKTANGGYELSDQTANSPGVINLGPTGATEALKAGGGSEVDYNYTSGTLSSIEVSDPATFAASPSELQIQEPQLVTQPTYAGSFGTKGSGPGQLTLPAAAALDAAGNIWVVDRSNNRVEKFDSGGNYLSALGTAGAGNGQLSRPTAIAISGNGDLLVADSGNSRVERFNSAGTYLSSFGSKGAGNGQFAGTGPEGIAIDSGGNIWVADTAGGRLEKFNSAGVFQLSVGTKGSGAGQFGEPAGLDVAPNGEIWVADRLNNRLAVVSSAGVVQKTIGTSGTENGQFRTPDEVEVDKLGNVWVGDQGNSRIQEFDTSGQFKAKFGTAGSGSGQFKFATPMGLATDSKGSVWVVDSENNRVQRWTVPIEKPAYIAAFGATTGALIAPADIATGVEGYVYVADRLENHVQKFDPSGKLIATIGAYGSAPGKFNRPTAIAIDHDGNLLVVDSGNNRVEKFASDGTFLSAFGTSGTGNGQFASPEGITAGLDGSIWVADTGNNRLEEFDESGTFQASVGSSGSGNGQLSKPVGLDLDKEGNVWVADSQNNRVMVFTSKGAFLRSIGNLGAGNGQFNRPYGVAVDSRHGNVWITDAGNQRVQELNLAGAYLGQFGTAGSGEGQFAMPAKPPAGIATDDNGGIWVSDVANSRVQHWQLGNYQAPSKGQLNLRDGDPKVVLASSGGLITSLSGNATGSYTYSHTGDDLTAVTGPAGRTGYETDASGRLTKVTLPNGTSGSVAYTSDGRVKSVTVDPAGAPPAKTTTFEYRDEPSRRTVVTPADAPQITYDIARDGSVLKWWNTIKPPTIEPLTGNLFDNRETSTPISAGSYKLDAKAYSPEGIASIDILIDGTQLADETKCEQDPEKAGLECVNPPPENEWVMETNEFVPGIYWIEVVATDRLGNKASQRFWINIPVPPPASIGAPVPPTFNEIKKFREDFGLEKVFPVQNEVQLDERIYNLIKYWNDPNSELGQVARASAASWGVPLRPEDVAEMQYRERYIAEAATAIPAWVAGTGLASSYAGYYVSHREGGIIHIGFTSEQSARVAAFIQSGRLQIPGRVSTFVAQPSRSLAQLEALQSQILEQNQAFPAVVGTRIDIEQNVVDVGASDVAAAQTQLVAHYGSLGAFSVHYQAPEEHQFTATSSYGTRSGRTKSAERIEGSTTLCSIGYGVWESAGVNPNGSQIHRSFLLDAGHCFPIGDVIKQFNCTGGPETCWERTLGTVVRSKFYKEATGFGTDGLLIRLEGPENLVPNVIRWDAVTDIPTHAATTPEPGMIACIAGMARGRSKCGEIVWPPDIDRWGEERGNGNPNLVTIHAKFNTVAGDSGGPIWERRTGGALGTTTGGEEKRDYGYFTPLLPLAIFPSWAVPGSLAALSTGQPLHLVTSP